MKTMKYALKNNIGITPIKEDILGDMMYADSLSYYSQLQAHNTMLNQTQKTFLTLIAGQGVFGHEPKVSYLFGFPRSISAGAIVLDIPITVTQAISDNNHTKHRNYQRTDMYASALEHALKEVPLGYIVPEQMFSTSTYKVDGFSTAKAFQKANAAGQKIFFITKDNMNEILPQLNHTSSTINAITDALNAGKEITVHQNLITLQGYSGTGYRIFDPITGDSADMISGGLNGGNALVEKLLNYTSWVYAGIADIVSLYYINNDPNGNIKVLSRIAAFISFSVGVLLAFKSENKILNIFITVMVAITLYYLLIYVNAFLIRKFADRILFVPLRAIINGSITTAISALGGFFSNSLSLSIKEKELYYV